MADYTLYWSRKPFRYVDHNTGKDIERPDILSYGQFDSNNNKQWERSLIGVLSMAYKQANDTGGKISMSAKVLAVINDIPEVKYAQYPGLDGRIGTIFEIPLYKREDDDPVVKIKTSEGIKIDVIIKDL